MNSFSKAFAGTAHIMSGRQSREVGQDLRGFTLLELLIVIAIIVILSVMLIIVINPVETLRKSRDSQRISDLNTLKTAMGIYTTTTASPSIGNCSATTSVAYNGTLYYSLPNTTALTKPAVITGAATIGQVAAAALAKVDGTGWIPVNFDAMTQGSPISALPVDPVNTVATPATPKATDLVYRYGCYSTTMTYEVDARLESNEYTTVTNRMASDGGDNDNLYEVGTNIRILPNGDL